MINNGILDGKIPGVKAGRKTIFIRDTNKESEEDLGDDIEVVDDFGANRPTTAISRKPSANNLSNL